MWTQLALNKPLRETLMALVVGGKFKYDTERRRLVPKVQGRLDSPWVFFGCAVNARNCHLWTKVMFRYFELVPAFCRFRCHKVVAKPANVVDTIRLYQFAQALPFFSDLITPPPGKAGMDLRSYTDNPWSAFWYANNESHANYLYRTIRKALEDHDMKRIAKTLIIKKSCTEMEVKNGPTNGKFWQEMTEDDKLLEDRLNDIFYVEVDDLVPQPNWHINGIIDSWLDHARSNGDHSGDKHYNLRVFRSQTYHDKES